MARQRQLFEDNESFARPQLTQQVRQELTRLLVQWLQALAQAIDAGVRDEQD